MDSAIESNSGMAFRKWHLAMLILFVLIGLSISGIAGYFRLSSESAALRSSLTSSVAGTWHKKFAVHVGGVTMAVLRYGSHWIHLPPEPRAAVEALRGAEVGIYHLRNAFESIDAGKIVAAADKAMSKRGWDRAVGVANAGDLVTVYVPRRGVSPGKMRCCLMVLHGDTLVVASARGNLEPLLKLAQNRFNIREAEQHFAQRRDG